MARTRILEKTPGYPELVSAFGFRVTHTEGEARRGAMQTPHGSVETPAFMPVGTRGAVKAITAQQLQDLAPRSFWGTPIIFI